MIVIADSGSTKTDWCLGNTKTNSRTVRTGGINPFHQSVDEIKEVIASTLIPQLGDTTEFTTIYFYGAGCIPEKTNIVKTALAQNFPKANILVESDLLGAAHALCGKTAGIACILGTGSNSCFYDGKKITANISPLGYILGDEGSGAVLGKRLVGDLLKHQLPDDLCQDFLKEYDLTPALILDKVYRQPLANRFLAGLTPFLFAHKHRPEIRNLLISCFTDFFTRNVMQYEYHDILVHFTGSIAFFFQEEVKEAALRLNVSIGKVLKSPLEGLKEEDRKVASAVHACIPQIEKLVNEIVERMHQGGRIFYLGAGTSGRLGVLDASEIPPTFGMPDTCVIGIIAGGEQALRRPVENAEDDSQKGWMELQDHHITNKDILIGIAASGTTPYVIGALQKAREHGILTASISSNPGSPLSSVADIPIEMIVGPEFITGSSRMKSGTGQKMILNMISTTVMIKLGRVKGNRMVNMQLSNRKLIDRGVQMLIDELHINKAEAKQLLQEQGSVKKALDAYKTNNCITKNN